MIDENKPKIPCWVIWSTSENGLVTLEAIDLAHWIAKSHKKLLENEVTRKFVMVKIEKSEANHLFAGDLDEKWWEMYGEQVNKRSETIKVESLRKENEHAIECIKKIREDLRQHNKTGDMDILRKIMAETAIYNDR